MSAPRGPHTVHTTTLAPLPWQETFRELGARLGATVEAVQHNEALMAADRQAARTAAGLTAITGLDAAGLALLDGLDDEEFAGVVVARILHRTGA